MSVCNCSRPDQRCDLCRGGLLPIGVVWSERDEKESFVPSKLLGGDVERIAKPPRLAERITNVKLPEYKCPACDNEFSHNVDESGTICTPDKCVSTGRPIPEDTMRWMLYERLQRNQL